MPISIPGVIIACFIGIFAGLLFSNDSPSIKNKKTEKIAAARLMSLDALPHITLTEEKMEEELKNYMDENFAFSPRSLDWAAKIRGYSFTIKDKEVTITVETNSISANRDTDYIGNAIVGFAKSRFFGIYETTSIVILGEKDKILLQRQLFI